MNNISKFIPHEKDKQRQREKNACIDRKLYRRKKWPILLLHLAFIFILTGAAITRYVGKDGKMELQEEETTDYVIPEDAKDQMVKTDFSSYNL